MTAFVRVITPSSSGARPRASSSGSTDPPLMAVRIRRSWLSQLPDQEHEQREADVKHVQLHPPVLQPPERGQRSVDPAEDGAVEALATEVGGVGREGSGQREDALRRRRGLTRTEQRTEESDQRLRERGARVLHPRPRLNVATIPGGRLVTERRESALRRTAVRIVARAISPSAH